MSSRSRRGPEPIALLGARRLRELLERHRISPSKALGQNFVIDPNTIRKVVDESGLEESDRVLEIGAGAGSLTLGLAGIAAEVVAVEFDRGLLRVLAETVGDLPNVRVLAADALRLDVASIGANKLVANLPYNIAVPLVMRVLEEAPGIEQLCVMTQREVGRRLAATPGGKEYGQVSVVVRYHALPRVAASISRRAFWPVPSVESVLVRLERREPPEVDRATFYEVVRLAFSQRRKTLRNALAPLGPEGRASLEAAGLSDRARAEEIPFEGFVDLARRLKVLRG